MKIAIYHNLPSGGGKRALHEMARRLAEHHQIAVYTLSTADHDFCDLRPYCARHVIAPFAPLALARRPFGRLNQGIRAVDLARLDALQSRIAAEIDRDRHDVAFVHNCRFSQAPGVLRFLRTPSVYYCGEPPRLLYEAAPHRPYICLSHGQKLGNLVDPLPFLYRRTLRKQDRRNALAATRVLVNSHYSRETFYRTYGAFALVGRLGVDAERFRPLSLPKEHRVISVGALTPAKGFDLVIQGLGLIPAERRPALTIISNAVNPPEHAYLANLAANLRVTVDFRVGVSDDELIQAYNRSLLTVYAPIMEPFGFVPLESLACGVPVVGVNEAGVRESVRHGETGLLVERDAAALAEAVAALLDDAACRERLGRQGRAHVEGAWNWAGAVQAIEAHLRRAAEHRS